MGRGSARVGERLAGDRDELPVVARGVQRELDHAVGARVAHLARRQDRAEAGQGGTTGADHELAHAEARIGRAARVHRREALVVVPVAAEEDVGPAVVEVLPQLLHVRVAPEDDQRGLCHMAMMLFVGAVARSFLSHRSCAEPAAQPPGSQQPVPGSHSEFSTTTCHVLAPLPML